jgi:hypothetical protein
MRRRQHDHGVHLAEELDEDHLEVEEAGTRCALGATRHRTNSAVPRTAMSTMVVTMSLSVLCRQVAGRGHVGHQRGIPRD